MILILSSKTDASTLDVLDWLLYYDQKYFVLYTDDLDFKVIRFNPNKKEFIIKSNDEEANLYDVTAVWNRRSGISIRNFTNQYIDKNNPGNFFLEKDDTSHYGILFDESRTLIEFIHYLIEKESVLSIGSFFYNDVNKLIVLSKAKEIGLDIPESYIITKKEDINKIQNLHPQRHLITKAIYEGIYRPDFRETYQYYSYVERLTSQNMEKVPDHFYPSLVQLELDKELELRIFYFLGSFYPMAIFSQDEEDAVVDFRKNDHDSTPLKMVPYTLPKYIEKKLLKLMNNLRLNSGSIDVVLDKEGHYVFLEVNPVGQYGMTSVPCNYYLDKLIAQVLCKQVVL